MGAVSDFVARYLPQAQQASARTGLPTDVILGQAGLESGWGTSNAATAGNNFFGISPGGSLATYATPDAGFDAYSNLINSGRYSGVSSVAGSSAQAIGDYLNGQGYSQTPDYGSRVAGATSAVDQVLGGLDGLGSGGATPAGGSPTAAAGGTSPGAEPSNPSSGVFGQFTKWLADHATRAVLILLAIILLAGATYLFATRTQQVTA